MELTWCIGTALAVLAVLAILATMCFVLYRNYWKNPFTHLDEKECFRRLRLAIVNDELLVAKQILSLRRITNLDLHTAQSTLLCIASRGGSSEIFKLLIEYGANISGRTPKLDTPLICASRNGHLECLEYLLENGVDVNETGHRGWTALHWASLNGRYEVAEMLIAYGANIEAQTQDGGTCIYYGCLSGHSSLVHDLLQYGANVNAKDNRGESPLHAAARQNGSALKAILKYGVKFELNNNGKSPLDIALVRGHRKFVDGLLVARPELLTSFHQDAITLGINCLAYEPREYDQVLKVLGELAVLDKNHFVPALKSIAISIKEYSDLLFNSTNTHISVTKEHLAADKLAMTSAQNLRMVNNKIEQPDGSVPTEHSDDEASSQIQSSPSSSSVESNIASVNADLHSSTEELRHPPVPAASTPADPTPHPKTSNILIFKKLVNSLCNIIQEVIRSTVSQERRLEISRLSQEALSSLDPVWTRLNHTLSTLGTSYNLIKDESMERKKKEAARYQYIPSMVEAFHDISCTSYYISKLENKTRIGNDQIDGITPSILEETRFGQDFVDFISQSAQALRLFVDTDSNLLANHFHFILELSPSYFEQNPAFCGIISALSFEQKRNWMRLKFEEQESRKVGSKITVDRHDSNPNGTGEVSCEKQHGHNFNALCQAIQAVLKESPEDLRGKLFVKFNNEAGVGAGVQREFWNLVSECLGNPGHNVFKYSSSNILIPLKNDEIQKIQNNNFPSNNISMEEVYRFVGRMLALSLIHEEQLNVKLSPQLFWSILLNDVHQNDLPKASMEELKILDPEIHKNLQFVLDYPNVEDLALAFDFGSESTDGEPEEVNELNKKEYVEGFVQDFVFDSCSIALKNISSGFREIVPQRFVSPFKWEELEKMVSGEQTLDLEDWKLNTLYNSDLTASSDMVVWFWQWMEKQSNETHKQVLQFVTGSSILPVGGFSKLRGVDSIVKFSLSRAMKEDGSLPTASTCFNMLKLPNYQSKEELETKMELAIREGRLGFSFN